MYLSFTTFLRYLLKYEIQNIKFMQQMTTSFLSQIPINYISANMCDVQTAYLKCPSLAVSPTSTQNFNLLAQFWRNGTGTEIWVWAPCTLHCWIRTLLLATTHTEYWPIYTLKTQYRYWSIPPSMIKLNFRAQLILEIVMGVAKYGAL